MGDIYQKLAEMQKQVEGMRQENRVQLELIKQENSTQMELIRYEIAQLMSTIGMKILDQPIQLHLEESSSVFAECSELVENEEFINLETQYYAYFYGRRGLFRVKIPSSRNENIKIEPVILNDPSNPLPHCMALFSHNHNIYIVGRQIRYRLEYCDGVYVFDPNKLQKLPIQGLGLLHQPKNLHDSFKPMLQPSMIQSEDQIYLISVHNRTTFNIVPFCFQSFDLTKNCFKTLEPPPFKDRLGTVVGFFPLCGFIYLFIKKLTHDKEHIGFIFNPGSSQWKTQSLEHFEQEKIPIPSSCIGDVGLSYGFPNKSQILVTLNVEGPAAYLIQLCDSFIKPLSYRRLDEIFIHGKYKTPDDYAHLHDIGQGRFCVVYRSFNLPLLIYVFKIDFEVEFRIQSPDIKESNPSSQILYSQKYLDPIPFWDMHFIDTPFLASSTSKDLKNKHKCKSRRHKSGGKNSNTSEDRDMAATSSVDKDVEERDKRKSSSRQKNPAQKN